MSSTGTINKVILIGEISHTPRWRRTEGSAVLCFKLTTQHGEHSEVHSIRLPGDQQELELKLGQLVHLEGRIRTTVFLDAQQVKRYKTEVVALRVKPLIR